MNPVLLKPQSDTGAQLIVRGRMAGAWQAHAFQQRKTELLQVVLDSFNRLRMESDVVIVEGAGSPAETNLRVGDIANMGFARAAGVPVVLVGDIDRGHVIAALVGAHAVLEPEDQAMIRGFIINKFRGDPALFVDGCKEIARRTGWPCLGVVPWLAAARKLPAEDAVVLERSQPVADGRRTKIVALLFSRIANFDDFDPLKAEPGIQFEFTLPGVAIPGDADLVILPGTKSTLADLAFLRTQGWDIDLSAHVRRGGRVLGLCGGFQMLGRQISDPDGIEGLPGSALGLGFLEVETVLTDEKVLRPVKGRLAATRAAFEGYEMHVGRTQGAGLKRPLLFFDGEAPDGAVSPSGRIGGTYVHGLFARGEARAALLEQHGTLAGLDDHKITIDALLDEIAIGLEKSLDIDALGAIAQLHDHKR